MPRDFLCAHWVSPDPLPGVHLGVKTKKVIDEAGAAVAAELGNWTGRESRRCTDAEPGAADLRALGWSGF